METLSIDLIAYLMWNMFDVADIDIIKAMKMPVILPRTGGLFDPKEILNPLL